MAQYKTGTVNVTNGSDAVVGVGTLFLANVSVGDWFVRKGDDVSYQVKAVPNDLSLTLDSNYAGTTASGVSYSVTKDFTANFNIPLLARGDIDTATVFARAMAEIDKLLGLNTGEWTDFGDTPTFVDADTFTLVGDKTADYQVTRRLRATDATVLYGTITASSFGGGITTVDVLLDSGVLSASLSAVAVGIASVTNPAISGSAVRGGTPLVDTINEYTAAAGVTIDGVLLKDSQVTTDVINEKTAAAGVTIDGLLLKDSKVQAPNGTALLPVYTASADLDTGGYFPAVNIFGIAAGGVDAIRFNTIASGVNYLGVTPAAAGSDPILGAEGADTDIGLHLKPKGTGLVGIGLAPDLGTLLHVKVSDVGAVGVQGWADTAVFEEDSAGSGMGITLVGRDDENVSLALGSPLSGAGVAFSWLPNIAFLSIMTRIAGGTINFFADAIKKTASMTTPAAGVNFWEIAGSIAGSPLTLTAKGTDADIDLSLIPKGVGSVLLPDGDVTNPSIAFANAPTTGIATRGTTGLELIIAGARAFYTDAGRNWLASSGNQPALLNEVNSNINPTVVPKWNDADTGMATSAANQGSLIAGAIEVIRWNTIASGVNYLDATPAAAGGDPKLAAAGSDTDIDLHFQAKGAGVLRFGTHAAIGAETVTGFITIKDDGGASRKVAVVS